MRVAGQTRCADFNCVCVCPLLLECCCCCCVQPQGFFARVESTKDGVLFAAERLYNNGNRPNPIRSITKAITAATFMALVDRGILTLGARDLSGKRVCTHLACVSNCLCFCPCFLHAADGHAADYIPAFKQGQLAQVTFRQLMSHTSGLPEVKDEGKALLDPSITLLQSATIIAQEYPLLFAPGSGFQYTEAGFQVVGAAMEAATGKTLQSLVKQYITDPVGMDNTNVSSLV